MESAGARRKKPSRPPQPNIPSEQPQNCDQENKENEALATRRKKAHRSQSSTHHNGQTTSQGAQTSSRAAQNGPQAAENVPTHSSPEESSAYRPTPAVRQNLTRTQAELFSGHQARAIAWIKQGITCDQNGKSDEALRHYMRGLEDVKKAVEISRDGSENMLATGHKLKIMMSRILDRIDNKDPGPLRPDIISHVGIEEYPVVSESAAIPKDYQHKSGKTKPEATARDAKGSTGAYAAEGSSGNLPQRPPPPSPRDHPTTERDIEEQFKKHHDYAYLCISHGRNHDDDNEKEKAVKHYMKGLDHMKKAINISRHGPQHIREAGEKSKVIMARILSRVEELMQSNGCRATRDTTREAPPSYEVATSPSAFDSLATIEDSILSDNMRNAEQESINNHRNANILFTIRAEVQIFFISAEGYVSAPSYPSSLVVMAFTEDESVANAQSATTSPPAFLKVGEWTYPLIPGCSPVLHATSGVYMFPDVTVPQPGSSVGVMIPESLSADDRELFEDILASFTALQKQAVRSTEEVQAEPQAEEEPVSKKISSGLVTAAQWVSWGLTKGSEKTGELLKKGTVKFRETVKPNEKSAEIDPNVQKGMEYAKKATGTAVQISGMVVKKLGDATVAMGKWAAPHIRKQGEKILPESMTKTNKEGGTSKMGHVAEVAKGGFLGWATIYVGLENAAKILGKSISEETVNVVEHKYGSDAGKLAGNTVSSAFNLGLAVHITKNLGVKSIAKRATRDTGKAYVQEYTEKKKLSENEKEGEKRKESDDEEVAEEKKRPIAKETSV